MTIRVGVLGMEGEGLGTRYVEYERGTGEGVGLPLATGFRRALLEAVRDFQPKFVEQIDSLAADSD